MTQQQELKGAASNEASTHHAGVLKAEARQMCHARPASKPLACVQTQTTVTLQAILVFFCMSSDT